MNSPAQNNPVPKGAHLSRAIGLYHQGRYDRMEAELRAELAESPEDHETLTWLALALLKLDRETEGLRVVEDAIRLRPDHADAHYVRARILQDLVRRDRLIGAITSMALERVHVADAKLIAEREAALAEAIRLRPDSPEYVDFAADLRFEEGRYPEGLALVERGLALDPQHVGCLYNRARILDRLDQPKEAQSAYGVALAVSPEHPGLHRGLGELLLRRDAPGRALEHLQESLRLQPDQESDLRPLIADAMKRRSRFYSWFIDHLNTPWVLACLFAIPLCLLWWSYQVNWRVADVLREDLIPAVGIVLLLFGCLSAIDPLFNVQLLRSPFGKLMLSDSEKRLAVSVASVLLVFLLAVVWALLMPERRTPIYLILFCLFWIDPIVQSFTLYPSSLQRIARICTVSSMVLVVAHLLWRWFGADDPETWEAVYPYAMLVLGLGYYLAFVPFILSRSASEFSFWRPTPRRRAVLVFWSLLLLCWLVLVAGSYCFYFDVKSDALYAVRQNALFAGVVFGIVLYYEANLIDWLTLRFGGKRSACYNRSS